MNFATLIFEGAEELDFVGPWEVFTVAAMILKHRGMTEAHNYLVSEAGDRVTCAKGMRVEAHYSFADAPLPDVLLVPGGNGTRRELNNRHVLNWIKRVSETAKWTTSVCTGSLLLVGAGLAAGRNVTTHWMAMDELQESLGKIGKLATFHRNRRWVVDGNIVTAAGISAGIDMALWLVGQIFGDDIAKATTARMEYDPAPPYPFVPA